MYSAHTYPTTNPRWVLGLTACASFMVALDLLVVSTALTSIRSDLGAPIGLAQWAVTAYGLSFAVLLLTGAALGDRSGAAGRSRPASASSPPRPPAARSPRTWGC